jgi:hypothetical protein
VPTNIPGFVLVCSGAGAKILRRQGGLLQPLRLEPGLGRGKQGRNGLASILHLLRPWTDQRP